MRILFLAHRVPYPPIKGDKIRAFHEIQGLAARGHDVHLFAFADDPADLAHGPALLELCRSVTLLPLAVATARMRALTALASHESLSLRYFRTSAMVAAVRNSVQRMRPDAAVVYSGTMAQYVPNELRPRTVVDLVDVDSEKWRDYSKRRAAPLSTLYRIEARRLRAYENALLNEFPHVVLTTRGEADLIDDPRATARIHALVNGVDTEYFRPSAGPSMHDKVDLVFTGAMDYLPNIDAVQWFADEVWPRLAHIPHLRFSIVGSRPARPVQRLAERKGIEVTGTVPDVRPYLQRAAVGVVPLRIARGVQNKVLEAMASGIPVVATPAAVAPLSGVRDGVHVRIASTPEDFSRAIVGLLQNHQLRRTIAASARAYIERHHRWDVMQDEFCRLVEALPVPEPALIEPRVSLSAVS